MTDLKSPSNPKNPPKAQDSKRKWLKFRQVEAIPEQTESSKPTSLHNSLVQSMADSPAAEEVQVVSNVFLKNQDIDIVQASASDVSDRGSSRHLESRSGSLEPLLIKIPATAVITRSIGNAHTQTEETIHQQGSSANSKPSIRGTIRGESNESIGTNNSLTSKTGHSESRQALRHLPSQEPGTMVKDKVEEQERRQSSLQEEHQGQQTSQSSIPGDPGSAAQQTGISPSNQVVTQQDRDPERVAATLSFSATYAVPAEIQRDGRCGLEDMTFSIKLIRLEADPPAAPNDPTRGSEQSLQDSEGSQAIQSAIHPQDDEPNVANAESRPFKDIQRSCTIPTISIQQSSSESLNTNPGDFAPRDSNLLPRDQDDSSNEANGFEPVIADEGFSPSEKQDSPNQKAHKSDDATRESETPLRVTRRRRSLLCKMRNVANPKFLLNATLGRGIASPVKSALRSQAAGQYEASVEPSPKG